MITCDTKHWTYKDVMRAVLFGSFIPRVPGSAVEDEVGQAALKMVVVADSGENYFTGATKYSGMDQIVKELTGLYSVDEPTAAIRVSLGMVGTVSADCVHPQKDYNELEMFLSMIGKGVDGLPVLRIAINLAEDAV